MRSPRRPERWLAVALAAAWLAGAAPAAASELTREQVDAQARDLRELPGLNVHTVERSLRLKLDDEPPPPSKRDTPAWVRWISDFVEWLNDSGRFLVWFAMALVVALGAVRLRQALRGSTPADPALHLPTHVRELDIRPESLPDDIGAAALAAWQRGETRAALSLLYRGALSRLVHRHAVPIRGSSTEGDCLRLARIRLADDPAAYLESLVAAWRQAVYADRPPADAEVQRLCSGFAPALGPAEERL